MKSVSKNVKCNYEISTMERLSELTDVRVYGGDCIVTPEGSLAIIDFNDWPSFAPCREEAARAIAARAIAMARNREINVIS